jgi:hypothetical protein
MKFQVGDRVRLRKEVERFAEFIAPRGLTGVVIEMPPASLQSNIVDEIMVVKMDEPLDGAESWNNCII